ncbi:hypothetical protein [Streptomyces sp. NPDC047525]|uniref:hypothetical protein n=1 Tax=Streptomyces sp. NPDC047525 TaxID=3155264 RepID=UPI00340EB915
MPRTPADVPPWPCYRLTAADDGPVTVTGPAAQPGPYAHRAEALTAVATLAGRLTPPRAVRAEAIDADGTLWPLAIHPDGTIEEAGPAQRSARKPRKATRAEKREATAKTAPPTPPKRRKTKKTPAQAPQVSVPQPAPVPQPQQPYVVPTVVDRHEPTMRVRITPQPEPPAEQDEPPTMRVRITPQPVSEQHERPGEDITRALPAQAAPIPQCRRPAPAGPAPAAPAPAASEEPPIPSALRIRSLAESGRLAEALDMAAAYDDAAARTHGPSHRAAIEAREIRAHIAVESGDLPGGITLYRDAAERWALQGQHEAADAAAGRAHALWLRITDRDQALAIGEAIVRMRTHIPGPGGSAYRKAARRLDRLRHPASH